MAAIVIPNNVINIDINGLYLDIQLTHRSVRPTNQILKNNRFSQTITTCHPYPELVTMVI